MRDHSDLHSFPTRRSSDLEFSYKSIVDADVREGNLRSQFDVVILPSLPSDRIAGGFSSEVVPPAYAGGLGDAGGRALKDRKSTRLNSSHLGISYAVFCLKK